MFRLVIGVVASGSILGWIESKVFWIVLGAFQPIVIETIDRQLANPSMQSSEYSYQTLALLRAFLGAPIWLVAGIVTALGIYSVVRPLIAGR